MSFDPFHYGQRVFFYAKDENAVDAKVQGTVPNRPDELFCVDYDGQSHRVPKNKIFPKDDNAEVDEGGGDRIAFEPPAAKVIIPQHAAGKGSNHKETNPKDALAGKKPRWFSYLPIRVLIGVGVAMYEGARKYGRHNYRPAGVRASVYVDAVVSGHLMPWWEGEDIDAESGRSHIDKAIASLMVLRDSMYEGNWIDDRPPAAKNLPEIMKEAGDAWALLQERHPDPAAPWTQRRIEGKE